MKNKKIIILIVVILLILVGVGGTYLVINRDKEKLANKVDDWEYVHNDEKESKSYGVQMSTAADSVSSSTNATTSVSSNNTLGYTVGGSQNVKNFRENIKEGYLPLTTDITYNGLYSEYYFDTNGKNGNTSELFYPSYSTAISKDPISGKDEYYLSVGLNSNIKKDDFKRPKLNLTIMLDISGSMSSAFNSYYYDRNNSGDNETKMKIAEKCICNLLDKLEDGDRFGVVLFDHNAYLGKKITEVSKTDMDKIKKHILEIEPNGGTAYSEAYKMSTNLFKDIDQDSNYQNRIIVITDAMPNMGETSEEKLNDMVKKNADNKIYTSFVGVEVDFNTELTEKILEVRGANYVSVHNSEEFNKILAEEFDYMVTPMVYDLDLSLKSDDYAIESVYGSDTANISNGSVIHVNTLFPSNSNSSGDVKGGIIVVKLKKKNENNNGKISINVSYVDNNAKEHKNSQEVDYLATTEHFDNTGIEKAVALARYANVIRNWIMYERSSKEQFNIDANTGIKEFNYGEKQIYEILGKHERKSQGIHVSENYKAQFNKMKTYLEQVKKDVGDDTINQEIELLDSLIK